MELKDFDIWQEDRFPFFMDKRGILRAYLCGIISKEEYLERMKEYDNRTRI